MAFVDSIGGDYKHRINLSILLSASTNNDMIAFINNQFTNFINTIISNYKYEPEASICFVLEKEKHRLEGIFSKTILEEYLKQEYSFQT